MTVDVNLGTFKLINDATVSCSQGNKSHQQAVLHVHDGIQMKNLACYMIKFIPQVNQSSYLTSGFAAIQGSSRDIMIRFKQF